MGQVAVPTSGLVYLDAQILIYSIERRPRYAQAVQPLWDAVQARQAEVVTSRLSIPGLILLDEGVSQNP
jgi:predicted nucleic acid-binding protein